LSVYLNIVQILISVALIALAVIQARGAGLGGLFGSDSSIYRTRRGVEKTMFQMTIVLAVVFFLISMVSVLVQS
jgi:preprotein translocase subunit SecG